MTSNSPTSRNLGSSSRTSREQQLAEEVAHQNEMLEDVYQEEAEGVRTQEECFQHVKEFQGEETEDDIVMEQILQGGEMI